MLPKILLLQARTAEDDARWDELRSFAVRAGLSDEQFEPFDLLTGPPSLGQVRRCDAVMVGGSGDYYVSKGNLPQFPALMERLGQVVATGQPMFASCFGFQLLVRALGGEVVYDSDNMEVGTFDLSLTPEGDQDELFCCLPREFKAQLGHKDRAERLPAGCLNLATSQRAPYQALRIPGQPIWATQFHPELTGEENRVRFGQYLDGYAALMNPAEREQALSHFGESPETEILIRRFLELVFA